MSKTYQFGLVEVEDDDLLWLQPARSNGWRIVGIDRRSPESLTVVLQSKTYGREAENAGDGADAATEQTGTPHEVDPVC